MKSTRFVQVLLALGLLLVPLNLGALAGEEDLDSDLASYLTPRQAEHMRALGYRSVEQFLSLLEVDDDMVCDELKIDPEWLSEITSVMPDMSFGSVEEYPLGLVLEDEPDIVGWEELLTEDYSSGGGEVNLISDCPPIKDQGHRGTCVAFASVAFLEYECINNLGEDSDLDLSEQFFYWACKERDGEPDEDGTYYWAAERVLEEDGACLESTWPYEPYETSDPGQGPPPEGAVEEAKEYTFSDIDYYSGPLDMDIDMLKNSLEENHIVVCGIPVYSSWQLSPEVCRTGEIPMPLSDDELRGGHAINLVGYKDDEDHPGGGYFILRNSWGEDWGEDSQYEEGYGTIPYAYINHYTRGGWIAG